jgi:hypothetical protein
VVTCAQLRWSASDFKPVVKGVEALLGLVTHTSVPARDFAELAAWIQNAANQEACASFSPDTPPCCLGHQRNERLQASMVHFPCKGSAPQTTDLPGGQVPLGRPQLASAIPHIKESKVRAIAAAGPQWPRVLPQEPTLAVLGHADLGTTLWFGLFAPASTPPGRTRSDPQRGGACPGGPGLPCTAGGVELRRAGRVRRRVRDGALGGLGQSHAVQRQRLTRRRRATGRGPARHAAAQCAHARACHGGKGPGLASSGCPLEDPPCTPLTPR